MSVPVVSIFEGPYEDHIRLAAEKLRQGGVVVLPTEAARLVLVDRGLDPKAVSAPEVGHAELEHEYAEAARAYVSGGRPGLVHWLEHCARAIGLGALEGRAVCEALVRETPRA